MKRLLTPLLILISAMSLWSCSAHYAHVRMVTSDGQSGRQLLCQDLRELRHEPEGMDIVGDSLYVVFWCGDEGTKIYRFHLGGK